MAFVTGLEKEIDIDVKYSEISQNLIESVKTLFTRNHKSKPLPTVNGYSGYYFENLAIVGRGSSYWLCALSQPPTVGEAKLLMLDMVSSLRAIKRAQHSVRDDQTVTVDV